MQDMILKLASLTRRLGEPQQGHGVHERGRVYDAHDTCRLMMASQKLIGF